MSIQKRQKGFTIIEVVLVLAIAGLIFMMVFIALPALQRSQRDTQRKQDLSLAVTKLTEFASNNRGDLPDGDNEWEDFKIKYLEGGEFTDPTGEEYVFSEDDGGTVDIEFDAETPTIFVSPTGTCDGENVDMENGSRKVAFRMKLEGGGVACQSN